MREKLKNQGDFKGINKLCDQCIKDCKQYENVRVIVCPIYKGKKYTKKDETSDENS